MANNGWQPIETAPRNTVHVRLGRWVRIGESERWHWDIAPIYEVKLRSSGFFGLGVDGVLVKTWEGEKYTHWMPLPPPPTE